MFNRLIILGAGGHGKSVADTALKTGYTDIYFIDDNAVGEIIGIPVIGRISEMQSLNDGKTDFVIAIGNNDVRKKIVLNNNLNWVTLIHPSAQIGTDVTIGEGTVVMANAVINPSSRIGNHCIINTSSVVEHDNVLDDYVHISPKAALGGNVRVGKKTHIGIGASVKNGISICGNCIIGAGAAVVSDLSEKGVYVGVPAKKAEDKQD